MSTLVRKVAKELESYRAREVDLLGRDLAELRVYRIDSRETDDPIGFNVIEASSANAQELEVAAREGEIQILGVTTNSLMKLSTRVRFCNRYPKEVVVDEASMMVFPHFLAIASLAGADSRLMVVGDHRQLAPIIAHDWEQEDRPPVVAYQPYVSAFEAVRRLCDHANVRSNESMILWSQLSYTFRLPEEVRRLIAPVYEKDQLELRGRIDPLRGAEVEDNPLEQVWKGGPGIYLLVHNESTSTTSNQLECSVLQALMESAPDLPQDSVAVVTPHRAQRTMLSGVLAGFNDQIAVIDTVEKLQGGEKPIVILSATVSDPAVITRRAEFVLSLERANVAFSRCQEKLIVVCSNSLLGSVPDDLNHYEASILWKTLRRICTSELGRVEIDGFPIKVLTTDKE